MGMIRSLVSFWLLMMVVAVAAPSTRQVWHVKKLGGRDYVPVSDLKSYYQFDKISREGRNMVLSRTRAPLKVSFEVGGNVCVMNGLKFVLCDEIRGESDDVYVSTVDLTKFIDPVLRPNFIKNAGNFRTVILDPGHGGHDSGATGPYSSESVYTLKLAMKVKALLEQRKYQVILTRNSNVYLTLQQRVEIANQVNEPAIFLSLHFNDGQPAAYGIETFVLSPKGVTHYGRDLKMSDFSAVNGNTYDSANIALATAVQGSVLKRLGKYTLDRGVKRARWSVISGVKHPAVLFEGGFVTNAREAKMLDSEQYQNALAVGIVDAIIRYRFAVSKGGK